MERPGYIARIDVSFGVHPVVALLGPRQCGKTTLARMFQKQYSKRRRFHYFDLEDPSDLARLENPMLTLAELQGTIIIDEIQRRPQLFEVLRVLVDQKMPRTFLILGSASRDLIRQSSETLAGRIRYMELTPFVYDEVDHLNKLWLRGGFPRSYLAGREPDSVEWRKAYVATYLERDIPNLGIKIAPAALRRFWMMLAHYHGNLFNASELGRSLGIAHTTCRHYLDILVGTFMIRELSPWFENLGKRQVKRPKIYFRDSGIFHTLLGINDRESLLTHPKLGASWEGVALEQILSHLRVEPEEAFFWALHGTAELDLLIIRDGRRIGFEFKYAEAPKYTASMAQAKQALKLDELYVISPGDRSFPLVDGVRAVGLEAFLNG